MSETTQEIKEIEQGLLTKEQVSTMLDRGELVRIRGQARDVLVGRGVLAKIFGMTGLGAGNSRDSEIEKIKKFEGLPYKPDVLADLSVRDDGPPLYEYLLEHWTGAVSTVPIYRCFDRVKSRVDREKLLTAIDEQARRGVGYMLVHASVSEPLVQSAGSRKVPSTSRGGSCVIRDMQAHGKDRGVYADIFEEVLQIMKPNNVVLALGSTFRPAVTGDCLDETHKAELLAQREFIEKAKNAGVQVVLEGLTHARLDQIDQFAQFITNDPVLRTVPLGALGPLGTDTTKGFDHATMAATAPYAAMRGVAHYFAMVTRTEHTGGVPTLDDQVEALRSLRSALQVVDSARFPVLEEPTGRNRGHEGQTCLTRDPGLFPELANRGGVGQCERCGPLCPFPKTA